MAEFREPTPQELGALLRGESPENEDQAAQVPAGDESGPPPDASEPETAATSDPDGDGEATPGQDGEAAQPAGGSDAAEDGEAEAEGPQGINIREAASKLGVEPGELYDQLLVTLPGGRGDVSVSELKQGYIDHAGLEDEREQLELDRGQYQATRDENELADLRRNRELQAIMAVARNVPAELVQEAQQLRTEQMAREGQLLMAARPEWRDNATRAAVAEEHMAWLAEFGFRRAEYDSIEDHRLLLVVDTAVAIVKRERENLEKLREARKQSKAAQPRTRRGTNGTGRTTRPRPRPATNEGQAAQVAELLRKG